MQIDRVTLYVPCGATDHSGGAPPFPGACDVQSPDIVVVPGLVSHLERMWEDARVRDWPDRAGGLGRLILFDRRGSTLAAWDLINGRLVRPFALALPLIKSYLMVCPKESATLPKIVTFRDWLLAEAADDAERIVALDA